MAPTVTKTASAPRPRMSWTARQGLSVEARTPSVAPKAKRVVELGGHHVHRDDLRAAPAIRAPWIAFSPTPPAPMTTTS
jgi:hypothetical protein